MIFAYFLKAFKMATKDFRKFEEIFWNEVWPKAGETVGMVVKLKALELVPLDTGQLKRSVDYKVEAKRVLIGTNVEHGLIMEYGAPPGVLDPLPSEINAWRNRKGVKIPAFKIINKLQEKGLAAGTVNAPIKTIDNKYRPWLRPALHQNKDKVAGLIFEELKKV